MNELLERSARLWHAGVPEVLGKGRQQYLCCARYSFVILAIVGGFTREAIAEFTGWDVKMVVYYAGSALSDEITLPRLIDSGLLTLSSH